MSPKPDCSSKNYAGFKRCGLRVLYAALAIGLSACNMFGASRTTNADSAASQPPLEPPPAPLYSAVGNPDAPVTLARTHPSASVVLMGGGVDVDEAFRWMIKRAGIHPGTGGHFVVIKATPSRYYDPYIFYSGKDSSTSKTITDRWVGGAALGLSSVETLNVPDPETANDPRVVAIVSRADAVFIGGGDQSNYIKYWKGSLLGTALRTLVKNNIPMGGTSAGLHVLGQVDFSGLYRGITPETAMKDPYNKNITFDPDPLSLTDGFLAPPALAYTIIDSHFDTRHRMGRLITFVSRIVAPVGDAGCPGGILQASTRSAISARGIGVNEETALLVQENGASEPITARRVTNISNTTESAVYFVRPSAAPSVCIAGTPLTIHGVEVKKLADSKTIFNLSDWSGVPVYETLDINYGMLSTKKWH